jgi:hypothetical protein
MANKKAGFSLRTKNEHMKSTRMGVHPAQMIIGDTPDSYRDGK